MSSTRHAPPGSPLSPRAYASAPEYRKTLLANLVAARCETVADAQDRNLIWWLQRLEHENRDGLKPLAAELVKEYPHRIGTPSMQKFGMKDGQVYNAKQVCAVRKELPDEISGGKFRNYFPIKGERREPFSADDLFDDDEKCQSEDRADQNPNSYPASDFLDHCTKAVEKLPEMLCELCLDPSIDVATFRPWFFPALIATLREVMAAKLESLRVGAVVTSFGETIHAALDNALAAASSDSDPETGLALLIQGRARTGKTYAVKQWCDLHPGQARYVQTPATNDDTSFLREVAAAIGCPAGPSLKLDELRSRVEVALRSSKLFLCVDEASFLMPQSCRRESPPSRLEWCRTGLINFGVPVAFIATEQFANSFAALEAKTGWSSEQFVGRLAGLVKLPDRPPLDDLKAVARYYLPKADRESINALADFGNTARSGLASIPHVVKYALHSAAQDGRAECNGRDIAGAILHIKSMECALSPSRETPQPKRGRPAKPLPEAPAAPASTAPRARVAPQPAPGAAAGRRQADNAANPFRRETAPATETAV